MRSIVGMGITPRRCSARDPESSVMISSTLGAPAAARRAAPPGGRLQCVILDDTAERRGGRRQLATVDADGRAGEPSVPVTCCASTVGTLLPATTDAASSREVLKLRMDGSLGSCPGRAGCHGHGAARRARLLVRHPMPDPQGHCYGKNDRSTIRDRRSLQAIRLSRSGRDLAGVRPVLGRRSGVGRTETRASGDSAS